MAWIILQPDDDEKSNKATKNIIATGVYNFSLKKNGARLRPGFYGQRSCTNLEKIFHCFSEKSTADCLGISQNQYYLCVEHFYWMCDSI